MIKEITERRFSTVKPMYIWPNKIPLKFDISTKKRKKAMFEALKLKSMPPFSQEDFDWFFSHLPIRGNSIMKEELMITDNRILWPLKLMEIRKEDNNDFDSLISIFIGRVGEEKSILEKKKL